MFAKVALFILLVLTFGVNANDKASVESILITLKQSSSSQCARLQAMLSPEKLRSEAEVLAIQGAIVNLCECLPNEIERISSGLNQQELNTVLAPAEFLAKHKTHLVDKCAATQAKYSYNEACELRFATTKKNSNNYCSCMREYLDGLSDSTLTQIGALSAQWIPQAAKAKNARLPEPEKPALLASYMAKERACSN